MSCCSGRSCAWQDINLPCAAGPSSVDVSGRTCPVLRRCLLGGGATGAGRTCWWSWGDPEAALRKRQMVDWDASRSVLAVRIPPHSTCA